jgi:hypothetical protein
VIDRGPRPIATTRTGRAPDAVGLEHPQQRFDLVGLPVASMVSVSVRHVDDLGAEQVDRLETWLRVVGVGRTLTSTSSRCDRQPGSRARRS